jgi:Tfp pilus assembly protein PilF
MGRGGENTFLSDANYGSIPREEALQKGRVAIEKALKLAPDMPEAHAVMGLIEVDSQNVKKAIQLSPMSILVNTNY